MALRSQAETELGSFLTPRERTIHQLNAISELFLTNLILKPLDEECILSLDKQKANALCVYLRQHWKHIDDRKLISLIHTLVDEEKDSVIHLVKRNMRLYCALKLRIESLTKLQFKEADAFQEMYATKFLRLIERYKTHPVERNDLFFKIKESVNGYYTVPVEHYSYSDYRKMINQIQTYLTMRLKEKFHRIEKSMMPGHARKDTLQKLIGFIGELENDTEAKPSNFTPLLQSFAKYFMALNLYPTLGNQVHEAQIIVELIQNLQELRDKLQVIPEFDLHKIPAYRCDFMDVDSLDVINGWHTLANAHANNLLKTVAPKKIVEVKQQQKLEKVTVKPEKKEEAKLAKPVVKVEKDEKTMDVPVCHDSPLVAKKLDDATSYYLIKLYEMIPEDNWKFKIRAEEKEIQLKNLVHEAHARYRLDGTIAIRTTRRAFNAIAEFYKMYPMVRPSFSLQSAYLVFEKLCDSIKLDEIAKEQPNLIVTASLSLADRQSKFTFKIMDNKVSHIRPEANNRISRF